MSSTVIALGDSITRDAPWDALGVPARPWAAWIADALGARLVNLAVDGARAADVLHGQLPHAGGDHALALLYVGVNDARALDFDADAFASQIEAILAPLAACAPRVLALTLPADLGRPRANLKSALASAAIERGATAHGVLVADLRPLAGPRLVLPDAVHPTALGQLAIADAAAQVLGIYPPPSRRVALDRSARARGSFALAWSRDLAHDLARRARERSRR